MLLNISDDNQSSWTNRSIAALLAKGMKRQDIADLTGLSIRTIHRVVMTLRTTLDAPRETEGTASPNVQSRHVSAKMSQCQNVTNSDSVSPKPLGTEIALSDSSSSLCPNPKAPTVKKSKRSKTSADSLVGSFKEAFVSRYDGKAPSWNWAIQMKHLKGLAKRCREQDEPEMFAVRLLEEFWKLTQTGDKFWKSQPFSPMTLNSEGIYTRVVKAMTVDKGLDIAAIIGGK